MKRNLALPPPPTGSGEGQARMDRQEPRTISVFKYWARSWNVQESCWPSVPQVRVAEVSGGERRKIPERAAGSEKRLFFFLAILDPQGQSSNLALLGADLVERSKSLPFAEAAR